MTRLSLVDELGSLWVHTAPERTFMDFIRRFDDWCAIEWGIDTKTLDNDQLAFLLREYCEHLRRIKDEKDF